MECGRLEFDAKLDRSEIGDLVALLNGGDAGIRGIVSGQVHLAGPVSAVGVEGELRISSCTAGSRARLRAACLCSAFPVKPTPSSSTWSCSRSPRAHRRWSKLICW